MAVELCLSHAYSPLAGGALTAVGKKVGGREGER